MSEENKGQEPTKPAEGENPDAQTFSREYVEGLRREAAGYRTKLKSQEEEQEKRAKLEAEKRGEFEKLYKEAAEKLEALTPQVERYRATISAMYEAEVADVPEDLRSLIPEMPTEAKLTWLKDAKSKGIFGGKQTGPAAKAKVPGDESPPQKLTSVQKIAKGLQKL